MESTGQKLNREEKPKRSKSEEQLLKSLSNLTVEEKLKALLEKCTKTEKENKKINTDLKQREKQYELLSREKDNLQKEYNKNILMRNKLEQVCREQQKLMKSVKSESLSKIREEEERRKENQAKFQLSINEINTTLTKNNEENIKLREDNIEMTKKLKFLAEQYQDREKQLEKINQHIQLENKLNEAKLAKAKMQATIDKEMVLKEKQTVLDELLVCKEVIVRLQDREKELKEQVHLYSSKYNDFQSSLQKSNNLFVSYKSELEKMCKYNKSLEKESQEWKKKWEKCNALIIEISTDKQVKEEFIAKTVRQMEQLQKLLRALQSERTILHKILIENNIERPSMPVLPPEPSPISTSKTDKIDSMVKNCAELKQTLAKLQGQMNEISSKKNIERSLTSENECRKPKNKKLKNKMKTCPTKDAQPEAVSSQNAVLQQQINETENVPDTVDSTSEKIDDDNTALHQEETEIENECRENCLKVETTTEVMSNESISNDLKTLPKINQDETEETICSVVCKDDVNEKESQFSEVLT